MALPPIYRVIVLGSRSTHSSKRKLEERGERMEKTTTTHRVELARSHILLFPTSFYLLLSARCLAVIVNGRKGGEKGRKQKHPLFDSSIPSPPFPPPFPPSHGVALLGGGKGRRRREEQAWWGGFPSLPSLTHRKRENPRCVVFGSSFAPPPSPSAAAISGLLPIVARGGWGGDGLNGPPLHYPSIPLLDLTRPLSRIIRGLVGGSPPNRGTALS